MSRKPVTKPRSIWIKTDMPPDESGYIVTLEVDDDTARILTPASALTYAAAVLSAVARAEYDAAVLNQLSGKLGISIDSAALMLTNMRADRPSLDFAATAPLSMEPGVNLDRKPLLLLLLDGKPTGQWTMADARSHALAVIEAVAVADLDSTYFQALIGAIGLEKPTARQVVGDVVNYRPEQV